VISTQSMVLSTTREWTH